MTETVDLLVRPEWLFPLDGETESLRGGEVAVSNGLIVHAGPARPGGWDAKEVVDANDRLHGENARLRDQLRDATRRLDDLEAENATLRGLPDLVKQLEQALHHAKNSDQNT